MTTQAEAELAAPRLYEKATTSARRYLAGIRDDQWTNSTPCTEWDVRQVVNHMVSGALNVVSIMGDQGPKDFGDVLGDSPLAAFDDAVAKAVEAFAAPGAMERTVVGRRGEQPSGDYALGQVQEMLVHGWDVAKATGQDTALEPEIVEVEYARARRNRERLRGTGAWGAAEAEAPADADTQTKYLAILGRAS